MPIFTEGQYKPAIGSELTKATAAGGTLARVEAFLTPEKLRSRFLFGIPMWAALPDTMTKRRAEYTVEMQQDAIMRAATDVELHVGVSVQPQQKTIRLPFDRNEYASLGYFQLPDAPITAVMSLAVMPAGDTLVSEGYKGAVYVINPAWIDPANFQRGQLQIIPFMPASAIDYSPMNAVGNGGAAFLSILSQLGWVASFWQCTFVCGFAEGRVPVMVNELLGMIAAVGILSELGATNRIGSYSVSLDAAAQSIATLGPNVYQQRITDLEVKIKALRSKLKMKIGHQMFSGNV